ncbi:hypothetical protein KUTeg_023078 [Tegillarca granosa]|uniref:Uncharacterized protein n=1 Tax=Tegillarca granosa TaxID=220873 RepID=A0ABQ9E0M0_TEGGR|nr:hypothetical protein KUTeg_023078 [Tegillarca granosa]
MFSILQLAASKGKSVGFKSSFFGTFSANVLFIPPEPIDFVSIFLNFNERLLQTPHSLAASAGLIIIFLLLSIPLARLDRKDALLWSYLPLIDDNHAAGFIYEIAVFTDVRSSKRFTSKPYFSLKGEDGETGTRVLLDGIRQVIIQIQSIIMASTKIFYTKINNYIKCLFRIM